MDLEDGCGLVGRQNLVVARRCGLRLGLAVEIRLGGVTL
jgi:hypothetical protein